MSEYFLHHIWQFQYYTRMHLETTEGEPLQIITPGHHNSHAGPDFTSAKVQIGFVKWIGSVEIHVRASEWYDHRHHLDAAYNNVVLHVVWQDDKPVYRADGTRIPTLVLRDRVAESLIFEYQQLVNALQAVPCHGQLQGVPEHVRLQALDRALTQRLEDKSQMVRTIYDACGQDLEETCYQLLSRNFGFKINADPFQQLARAVPYKMIRKHSDKPVQIEALLFGQAGFLESRKDGPSDAYHQHLRREYGMLASKYALREARLHPAQWRFMRLRPANFPTVRIAQLAALLHDRGNIFSRIIEAPSTHDLRAIFSTDTSGYWKTHYRFGKPAQGHVAAIGTASVDNILINTVAPLLVFYSQLKDDDIFTDRAITLLEQIAPEQNAITKLWAEQDMKIHSAFDSQALLQLDQHSCRQRRCLDCAIGCYLLKPRP